MDFDKLKVYGDTFISDGLVFFDISSDTNAENKESTQQKSRFFPYLFRALPLTYFFVQKKVSYI